MRTVVEERIPTARELVRGRGRGPLRLAGVFHVFHVRDGGIIDEWDAPNIITDEGLDHVLTSVLAGGTQITSWFLALKDNTGDPIDGTETYAAPAFTEITDYSEANRPAWTAGAVAGQSVDNSGSPASFSINATVSIFGIAVVGGGTGGNTKGDTAGGGTMYSLANFSAQRDLNNGDTLEVTYTATSADDGV